MVLDARAFTAFEQAAHDRIAPSYATHFASLTSLALGPLLEAARIAPGHRVLDVATGPGVAAREVQAHGAVPIGLDVSAGMIALARVTHPEVTFCRADVTSLPFADGAFDTVICNFGLGHFPEPEAALAECVRVLAPGGTLAFSWWDHPARQRVQGLFREAIVELGLPLPATVPPGHDTFRFSDPDVFGGLLRGVGLDRVRVVAHGTTHLMPDVDALWRAGMGGLAVTGATIEAQDAATQARAREVIARRAEAYHSPQGLEIPISFLIGIGQKT
jgi:SAM-dependent methyltransferase